MPEDEESDSPQHCACGEECLECEELPSGDKVGALLSRSLTTDGVAYVTEAIADGGEVAEFWKKEFESAGHSFDLIEIAEKSSGWGDFWQGYCAALCFTAHDESDSGDSLFPCYGEFTDSWDGENEVVRLLDTDDMTEIKREAADFFLAHRDKFNDEFERAGADFHYSRGGHGVGFSDRDCYAGKENELHKLAKQWGSCELIGGLIDGEQTNVYVVR